MNASDDNELGIGTVLGRQNDRLQHAMLHCIQRGTKSGQGSEFGTIQRPERPSNFPGTGRQNSGLSRKKSGRTITLETDNDVRMCCSINKIVSNPRRSQQYSELFS